MIKNLKFYIPGFLIVLLLSLKNFHKEGLSEWLIMVCAYLVLFAMSGYQFSKVGSKFRKASFAILIFINVVGILLIFIKEFMPVPSQVLIAYPVLATAIIYQVAPLLKSP